MSVIEEPECDPPTAADIRYASADEVREWWSLAPEERMGHALWMVEVLIDTGQRIRSVDLGWSAARAVAEEMRDTGAAVTVTMICLWTGEAIERAGKNLIAKLNSFTFGIRSIFDEPTHGAPFERGRPPSRLEYEAIREAVGA